MPWQRPGLVGAAIGGLPVFGGARPQPDRGAGSKLAYDAYLAFAPVPSHWAKPSTAGTEEPADEQAAPSRVKKRKVQTVAPKEDETLRRSKLLFAWLVWWALRVYIIY